MIYATFKAIPSIIIAGCVFVGCSRPAPIPESVYQRAEQLVQQGSQLLRANDLRGARLAFELAAELAPMAAALDGQGCVAMLEGRFEEGEKFLREACRIDRNYDQAWANLGLLLELQGRRTEAKAMYMKYLDKHPGSAQVKNNLAALEYDGGRGKMETMEALEKAGDLSDLGVIRANLGVIRANTERLKN